MNPLDDLRLSEGEVKRNGRHVLYCDRCQRPWKECEGVPSSVCPGGEPTLGYGRTPALRGLSQDEADMLAVNDIAANVETCIAAFGIEAWNAMGYYDGLSPATWPELVHRKQWATFTPRHRALLELAHGLGGFDGWPRFRLAIQEGRYDDAADELEWSDPATKQNHTRIWTQWRSDLPGEQRLERIQRRLRANEE